MSSLAIIINATDAPVTVDSAKNSTGIYAPQATFVAYSVVASASSSPVGTTLIIQGSVDNTNWIALSTAVTVSGNGVFGAYLAPEMCSFLYYRLAYARSSGSYVATTTAVLKGSPL